MGRPAAPAPRLPAAPPETARTYLRPVGLTCGKAAEKLAAAGTARRLAGGPWFFAACEVVLRAPPKGIRRATAALEDIEAWAGRLEATQGDRLETQLERLTAPRFAPDGQQLKRPLIMGVIDMALSSDPLGGDLPEPPEAAVAHGRRLAAAGADLLEVVGQSVRHGADAVAPQAETDCILPLIRGLNDLAGVTISVDTLHSEVAMSALAAGAGMISDGAAPTGGPESLSATTVLRAQGGPADATAPASGREDLVFELFDQLEARIETRLSAGISRANLVVDPGSGPAGKDRDNTAILKELALFHGLGCPILLGLPVDAAAEEQGRKVALHALDQGIQILRTHDVSETRRVLDLWERLIASGR